MADSLTFEIHPDTESVWLDTLVKTMADIERLVKQVDLAVTRQKRGRPWVVRRLHSSVPTMTLAPALDGMNVVDTIAEGLGVLTSEKEPTAPPEHFSEEALDTLREMRRRFRGRYRANKVAVWTGEREREVATIREDIDKRVDRVLRGSYSVLGSLEGTLEATNMRPSPPTFTIWERMTGRAVRCSFDKDKWIDAVLDFMKHKKRVLVAGKVTYFRNGMPRFISDIGEVRDMTPDETLPKGDFGSVPDLTEGKDAVDYIRSLRD